MNKICFISDIPLNLFKKVTIKDNELQETLEKVLSIIYYKNYDRVLRTEYLLRENEDQTIMYQTIAQSYFDINYQKLKYLLESVNNDFLTYDNINYNIDYYGGTGQRDKMSSLNNKDKLKNYTDITENKIFRDFINMLCVSYISGPEWGDFKIWNYISQW